MNDVIINFFSNSNIYIIGLIVGLFTWAMTAMGAALVYFVKGISSKVLDSMLGFAAGVMIAASFFSLIIPALDYAQKYNKTNEVIIVIIGFMLGVLFLILLDTVIPHLHIIQDKLEGPKTSWKRSTLLVLAITLHNIPEGLAVGVALGAFNVTNDPILLGSAISLAIGIGLQNFPEGSAVSFPLKREGMSNNKSFFFGQLSAVVEPISILIGIYLVTVIQSVLALLLAFAAGAMMFVVVEELIPESQAKEESKNMVSIFTMLGLCVMMALDILLG